MLYLQMVSGLEKKSKALNLVFYQHDPHTCYCSFHKGMLGFELSTTNTRGNDMLALSQSLAIQMLVLVKLFLKAAYILN